MVNNLVPLSTQRGWIRNSTILVFVGQKLISTKKKQIILQPVPIRSIGVKQIQIQKVCHVILVSIIRLRIKTKKRENVSFDLCSHF